MYETINGNPARIICDDLKGDNYSILSLVYYDGCEYAVPLTKDFKRYEEDNEPYLIEVDPLRDLKRVKSEGARIECYDSLSWIELNNPEFNGRPENYRILGGISIESWDAHKDVIKAFWDGADIEWEDIHGRLHSIITPLWDPKTKYRVKPTTKKVTLKEVAEKFNVDHIEIVEDQDV